jgi:hypothetical protein
MVNLHCNFVRCVAGSFGSLSATLSRQRHRDKRQGMQSFQII